MNNKEKTILIKLFKIAENQQKAIMKLAQRNPNDPIWYGKLAPNDPRNHDPLYGGEVDPDGGSVNGTPDNTKDQAPENAAVPPADPNWLDKYMREQNAEDDKS